jgi:uncharacterized protein YhdP
MNDLTGQTWEVDIENARLPNDIKLKAEMPVLATGEKTGDLKFKADIIRAHRNLPSPFGKAIKKELSKKSERNF